MRLACEAAGLKPAAFDAQRLAQSDTVIDALLGTGLERDVTGLWRTAIEAINRSGLPVLAVDVPSGLHADTGRVMGAAVRAQATLSFIGLKPGLFTAEGPAHAGDIYFDDLGKAAGGIRRQRAVRAPHHAGQLAWLARAATP